MPKSPVLLATRFQRRALARSCARALVRSLLLSALAAPSVAHAQYPPVVTRSHIDPSRGVNFHAVLLPDTVYVGQQATYQIGVFLNQETRQRLRRNPEFVPPETRSLLVYDLPDAKAPLVGTIDGRSYEVHVFQRAFFALTPGRFDVPPSRLTYSLPQSASFFSREDTHALRSEALALVVLPVPTAGRPADWAGAVGIWRARLRVDSASGKVGNPLVVTLRIEGQGNVTLLPRPRISVEWGTVVPADERVELDSTPATLRGAKEFDWLVTPHVAGRQSVPSQRFSYFDPIARRFAVATTGAVAVVVAEGDAVAVDSASIAPAASAVPSAAIDAPTLGIRAELGVAAGTSWFRSPWFLAVLVLAPWPALVGAFARRRRRPRSAPTSAERLASAERDGNRDAAALRRLVHDTLRERLGLDAGLALARGTLVAALRHEGVTLETARRGETLLRLLDAAVFSGDSTAYPPAARDLADLCTAINREARRAPMAAHATRGARKIARSIARSGAPVVLAIVASLALFRTGMAQQQDDQSRAWGEARTAYAGRDYALAARHFGDIARSQPRFPNAWANAGTAAWMATDTARAIQGWQRALRMTPLDTELRDRLALARAVQDRGPALVPPVPVQLMPVLLLLTWLAGWGLLARRAWARRPIALHAAWLTVSCAAMLVGAAWLDEIQTARQFGVIARSEPLRVLPVLGADLGSAPLTGEVARILQRQGAWVHVRLDGAREGWIASELLLPLGDD